jgi:hypothetical protein
MLGQRYPSAVNRVLTQLIICGTRKSVEQLAEIIHLFERRFLDQFVDDGSDKRTGTAGDKAWCATGSPSFT